jgi:hypothetical protein
MINPSFQTNPSSIRREDSFILTNLNLPDDKRREVPQRSSQPLFVVIKRKATGVGGTTLLNAVEKKKPK